MAKINLNEEKTKKRTNLEAKKKGIKKWKKQSTTSDSIKR